MGGCVFKRTDLPNSSPHRVDVVSGHHRLLSGSSWTLFTCGRRGTIATATAAPPCRRLAKRCFGIGPAAAPARALRGHPPASTLSAGYEKSRRIDKLMWCACRAGPGRIGNTKNRTANMRSARTLVDSPVHPHLARALKIAKYTPPTRLHRCRPPRPPPGAVLGSIRIYASARNFWGRCRGTAWPSAKTDMSSWPVCTCSRGRPPPPASTLSAG